MTVRLLFEVEIARTDGLTVAEDADIILSAAQILVDRPIEGQRRFLASVLDGFLHRPCQLFAGILKGAAAVEHLTLRRGNTYIDIARTVRSSHILGDDKRHIQRLGILHVLGCLAQTG